MVTFLSPIFVIPFPLLTAPAYIVFKSDMLALKPATASALTAPVVLPFKVVKAATSVIVPVSLTTKASFPKPLIPFPKAELAA